MKQLKRFFLSRKTVLALIVLILTGVLVAYLFPQKMTSSQYEIEQWKQANSFWAPLYDFLGLDHVYTTPWFASLLFIFLLVLILSTIDQIRIAMKKSFGSPALPGEKSLLLPVSEEELTRALKISGYRRTYHDGSLMRFIRHPWGYWGNAMLHLGIVIVIASSLLITVTGTRGLLHLVKGETYLPGNPWMVEETGMFGTRFILPVSVTLNEVIAEFWETDDVKNISTTVTFTDLNGKDLQYGLGINRAVNLEGIRIYQGRSFGDAFYVVFTGKEGDRYNAILEIESPSKREQPGYGNFFIEGIPYKIKAKYFADADKKSMDSRDPLLSMRFVTKEQTINKISPKNHRGEGLSMKLDEKENILGEVSLRTGETGHIGDYAATLVRTARWSGVIFVRERGMSGIFIGFFIMMAGGSLTYFLPPREIAAVRENKGFLIAWRASRFEKFYEDEFIRIKKSIDRRTPPPEKAM